MANHSVNHRTVQQYYQFKQVEMTDDYVVDVGVNGRAVVVIDGRCVAVAGQLGKQPNVVITLLLRASLRTRIRRLVPLLHLLHLLLLIGRCRRRCSLLGGAMYVGFVKFTPQQSMKKTRLLV